MKKVKATIVTSKFTGKDYYVVKSPRGRYFYLVPKSHPAQKAVCANRCDYTKPVEVEVA